MDEIKAVSTMKVDFKLLGDRLTSKALRKTQQPSLLIFKVNVTTTFYSTFIFTCAWQAD